MNSQNELTSYKNSKKRAAKILENILVNFFLFHMLTYLLSFDFYD